MKTKLLLTMISLLVVHSAWSRQVKQVTCESKDVGFIHIFGWIDLRPSLEFRDNFMSADLSCPGHLLSVLKEQGSSRCAGVWMFGSDEVIVVDFTQDKDGKINARANSHSQGVIMMDCRVDIREASEREL